MFVQEYGSSKNPALVLLHGGGLSGKSWKPVVDRLKDFYCIVPDLPEQGESRDIPFTLDGSADLVAELIHSLTPGGKAHVAGLSLGGAVTLTLLRRHPQVVETALVSGTAAKIGKFLGWVSLSSLGMIRNTPKERLAEASLKQFGIPEEYRDLVFQDLVETSSEAFMRTTIEALMAMELPLENSLPLLSCVGENETIPAKQAVFKLLKQVPHTLGVIIPRCGHVWPLQDPPLCASLIRAWCSRQPLPEGVVPVEA
jgi:pimeloyl-ACP methyl ester carboxylesterase